MLFLQANRLEKSARPQGDQFALITIGPALAHAGYAAEYERFCHEAITRYSAITDPVDATMLLKSCLLMPASESVMERLQPVSDNLTTILGTPNHRHAVDPFQGSFTALSLAMHAYRSGDFAGALEWNRKCLASPDTNQVRIATAHVVSAMAAQRLNQTEQAKTELSQARAIFETPFEEGVAYPRGAGNGLWQDWAIARVLEREATGIVEGRGGR